MAYPMTSKSTFGGLVTFLAEQTKKPQFRRMKKLITRKKRVPAETASSSSAKSAVIQVNYDVGFNNTLYIRGSGGPLSWEKGLPLENVGASNWTWSTDQVNSPVEFKLLINDELYETGENRHLEVGVTLNITPQFNDR